MKSVELKGYHLARVVWLSSFGDVIDWVLMSMIETEPFEDKASSLLDVLNCKYIMKLSGYVRIVEEEGMS